MKNIMNILDPISSHRNRVLFLLLFLFLFISGQAQKFSFTPRLEAAYEKIINLELRDGQLLIDSLKREDPNNVLIYHIENYIDFFTCFINEEETYFNSIKHHKEDRLSKIRSGDINSPYYRFSQAEILLQWSLVRLKFREYAVALFEINKAIRLLEENVELYPDFLANKKSLSALHALVGTIPEKYKNMLSWVSSFNGSIWQGQMEINEVYEEMQGKDFIFEKEVISIKALIELHLANDKQKAYETVQNENLTPDSNPLICFIVANITHQAGYNDEAINILQTFKPKSNQYPLYYLDYLQGIYKLNRLDLDSDRYIRRYLNYFNGQNYIKEAYQKLAWFEWAIHGNELEYNRNMKYCAVMGNDLLDEDKQAKSLSESDELPNRNLLKARLLNDGGYLQEALQLLRSIEQENRTRKHEIEYFYRRGRIAQGLMEDKEAISYYLKCLELPFDKSQYYQTAASLYLAQVYEGRNEIELSKYYFESCIQLDPQQYKESLHQKAKAGLLRLSSVEN